jgi:nucleotide-binding universal stress UspA family protein
METRTILIPLDGSTLAETAVARAAELSREKPSTLILLRAAEARTFPGADPTEAQVAVVREAEEYLAQVQGTLAAQGLTDVKTSVWYGPPAPAVVEAARVHKADLIVMTTHGRSGIGRLVLGSVAESVLRGTEVPILLLRAPGAPLEAPRAGAPPKPAEASRV